MLELLHALWRELDGAYLGTHAHKLASFHGWPQLSAKHCLRGPSHLLHRYLQLEHACSYVLRDIARFRLCAHTLRVEIGCKQIHNRHCD